LDLQSKIIESVVEIFSTMLMLDVASCGEPEADSTPLVDSITGIVGLAGTHKGCLAIHLPNKVAMTITSNFLGMDVEEINADVEDAVGELANMLGGNVKSILSEKGRDIELSLPTTVSGHEYDFQPTREVERFLIQFEGDAGQFCVELQLEK
jgi:chemotaxis protein CheX